MSMTNNIHLGEIPVCSEATVLPIVANETGTWAFMTTFNGAYQYIQFTATEGQNIVVPTGLNEDYTYTFKLFTPDSSILNDTNYTAKTIPLLQGADHTNSSGGNGSLPYTTGKLQFIATDSQVTSSHVELTNAKQVVVFIEGAIRHEGYEDDEYVFSQQNTTITYTTPLTEGQKITII